MLRATKLNKYYRKPGFQKLHVINNTSLEIPEKGIVAVIGESGAGKTTLINTISGLDAFKDGTIEFDETKMSHYQARVADKIRMKNYGFIFQNYYLLENETVYNNVKISLDAFDISEEEKKQRVNYVLNQLGIAKYTNKNVSNLSGGEQQRVSIARALVKSPRVIFADEPTGSLDENTTFTVLNILKKISQNCAVFIVTHKRDIISYYADYIIELSEGVVVKEFTPSIPEGKTLAVDQNIYLPELNNVKKEDTENIQLDIYSDGSQIDKRKVQIAIRNNKVYLEASENIIILNEKSENHLIDAKRYEIKNFVDNDFEYHLEPIPYSKNNIGFKELMKKSFQNFRRKSPIKSILKIVCALLSVVSFLLIEGVNTIDNVDLSSALTKSKGNLVVETMLESATLSGDPKPVNNFFAYYYLCNNIENADIPAEALFINESKLTFTYTGFYQLKKTSFVFPSYDFKNINNLDKSTLIFGSMPKNPEELVVDDYILKHLLDTSLFGNVVTNYGFFIGKTLTDSSGYTFTISGICHTKNPTIYGYECITFVLANYASRMRIIDIDCAKEAYPETFKDINVEPGHYLKKYSDFNKLSSLQCDGIFADSPYDAIINKADISDIKAFTAIRTGGLYISTDGSQNAISDVMKIVEETEEELKDKNIEGVYYNIVHTYQNEYDVATATYQNILKYVIIIAIVIGVIALLLIILTTYLSMLNQISDIAVYRSLGYSSFYLGLIYLVELFLISLLFTSIGGIVTYASLFILDVIPLISYTLYTSFIYLILSILALTVIISIIGIIPIAIVFRLTPAQIYNRFNKKINNN